MLENCRSCHWWIPIKDVGDTGRCKRFPPSVIPDYTINTEVSGEHKTVVEALTHDKYGVFPMTQGSNWCGEWTPIRLEERELLQREEERAREEFEEFARRHPGALHRIIP